MKEDADAVVETKEDALEVAEDVLDEAIKARDDAYLDAGVNGNAELLARDEAMEEAAESYEQAHAAQVTDEAAEAESAAKVNCNSATTLTVTP